MSLIEDLEKAWEEAEKIEKCQAGDILISHDGLSRFNVYTAEVNFAVGNIDTIRRYKKAPVVVDDDVIALIAEYKDYPGLGRHVFTRSGSAESVWEDEEGSRCTLDDLQNIRAVKDEGEYL